MNEKTLRDKVLKLSENGQWNCCFDFPFNIKTRTKHINSPGYNLNKWPRLSPILKNLLKNNKTVLDIGCGDGYYSIECAKMGFEYVVGSDLDPLRIKRADLAKEVYALDNVHFKFIDLYKDDIAKFDIAMALGLLHRIPDIEKCLRKMSQIADTLILEFKTYDTEKAECLRKDGKSKSNIYNPLHFIPSINFIKSSLQSMGYTDFNILPNKDSNLRYKRSIVIASR